MLDTSESQRGAETLAHFKALFEAQPSALLVLDRELRIVAVSEAYLRATRTQRRAIVGRPAFEVFPDDGDAAGIGPLRASFERVLASGHPEQMPVMAYAIDKPLSQGGGFEKRWWSPYQFSVLDAEGQVVFIVQRLDDVTQYVREHPASASAVIPQSQSAAPHDAGNFEHAQLLAEANRRLGLVNARLAFFAELSEATRPLLDARDIVAAVVAKLGRHLKVSRCVWMEFAESGDDFEIPGEYVDGVVGVRGFHKLSDFRLPGLIRGESSYVTRDVEAEPEAAAYRAAYRKVETRAAIFVPQRTAGRFVAALAVHQSRPRDWTRDEIELVEQVAERCRDALERARAARALTLSEQHLRDVLDRVPEKIFTFTPQGVVAYASPVTLAYLGRSYGDQVAGWLDMVHPEDRALTSEKLAHMLAAGKDAIELEMRLRRHDGTWRWHLVRYSPLKHADGSVRLWIGVWTDLHDIKQAQLRLGETDRAKDEFLATLAHELRNPIAPIANGVAVLKRAGEDPLLRAQMLDIMSRQLAQMVRLVDDLLDVSRISTGKLVLRREAIDLAGVVRSAVESVDPLFRARGHRLEIVLPDPPVSLSGDAARLGQVLTNLLTNSAKYSERPGTIRITAARAGDELCIAVQDEGIGIAPDALLHVFELFAQADRALSRSQGGLGIGLSLVRKLVELHGGRVAGASEGLGRGSTFTVYLPLTQKAPLPAAASAVAQTHNAAAASIPASGRRVLVADDNHDSARTLALLLRVWGHEVVVAFDGIAAVERAAEFKPDAMVLDLGMPRRDGLATAREIRAQPWGRDVSLIALSGWGAPADRELTRAAGFDHHLVKPVETAALEKLLESGASGD